MKDISNQKFGRLTAIRATDQRKNGSVVWLCKCECGNECFANSNNLVRGTKKSCGCYRSEVASAMAKTGDNRRTHGMKRTKIYSVWQMIKYRCNNPHYHQWKDYGGRGISICDEWANDFQVFYDYVSKLPHFGDAGCSIDRINNNGNYEPNNIRWATKIEQNRNGRNVKKCVSG